MTVEINSMLHLQRFKGPCNRDNFVFGDMNIVSYVESTNVCLHLCAHTASCWASTLFKSHKTVSEFCQHHFVSGKLLLMRADGEKIWKTMLPLFSCGDLNTPSELPVIVFTHIIILFINIKQISFTTNCLRFLDRKNLTCFCCVFYRKLQCFWIWPCAACQRRS